MATSRSPALVAVALLLCLPSLAGCAAPPAAGPAAHPPLALRALRLELSGCTGWEGPSVAYPAAIAPGQAPRGWEPQGPPTDAVVTMGAFACDRLSLGRFERGPIRLLYDAHNRATFPEACHAPGTGYVPLSVLHALWVDDAEVAAELRDAYHLPAAYARLDQRVQAVGAARLLTWAWGEGAARSNLTVVDHGPAIHAPAEGRLFWEAGGGIAMLALAHTFTAPPSDARLSYGTLAPSTLAGSVAGGAYLGNLYAYPALATTGAFTFFRDRDCREPGA